MEGKRSDEQLLERGFMPEQIESLCRIRCIYAERERKHLLTEQRRLEFVRWLVLTGRLTDKSSETSTL